MLSNAYLYGKTTGSEISALIAADSTLKQHHNAIGEMGRRYFLENYCDIDAFPESSRQNSFK